MATKAKASTKRGKDITMSDARRISIRSGGAAEKAGEKADRYAERGHQHGDQDDQEQGRLGAVDQARKQVASKPSVPSQCCQDGAARRMALSCRFGIVGSDQRGGQGHEDEQEHEARWPRLGRMTNARSAAREIARESHQERSAKAAEIDAGDDQVGKAVEQHEEPCRSPASSRGWRRWSPANMATVR